MELDTFLPVYMGSWFKKSKIYLDIVDPIAETKFKILPFSFIFDYMEVFFLKYRKYNILPNDNRVDYYKQKLNAKVENFNYIIIENIPFLFATNIKKVVSPIRFTTIGYFGTLEDTRGIIELIDFVKLTDLKLIIAGGGQLQQAIIKKVSSHQNIQYLGSFQYNKIEKLYEKIDFLWAYYSPNVFLHKFASPNKYYEHLAFKTPIIINQYVPQSKNIIQHNSGIVIDDDLNENTFNNLLKSIEKYKYSNNNFSLWKTKYSNYKIILNENSKI